jgi:hypothetical protein
LGATHWAIEPADAEPPLRVVAVKVHQQFESPTEVVATVRRRWRPTFDAMATPFSAVCAAYATLEDDILALDTVPRGSIVYANPAYASSDAKNGADGIELHLAKLIETDVHSRGCTLVALLPNLSDTAWYRRFVLASHEIHFVASKLVFPNPFTDVGQRKKSYLWECRSYILCVWRPDPPPAQPTLAPLFLDAVLSERIELRSCRLCSRVRVLPRWVEARAELKQGRFVCTSSPDGKYNSCAVPEFVPIMY